MDKLRETSRPAFDWDLHEPGARPAVTAEGVAPVSPPPTTGTRRPAATNFKARKPQPRSKAA